MTGGWQERRKLKILRPLLASSWSVGRSRAKPCDVSYFRIHVSACPTSDSLQALESRVFGQRKSLSAFTISCLLTLLNMEGKRHALEMSKKDPKKRKQYISGRGRGQVAAAKYKIDAAQIHSGLRGIFISTNHLKEDLAARETLAMLLEVAPEVYPQLFDISASCSDAEYEGEQSVMDIEAELKKERDNLKERRDHFSLVVLPHAKNKAFVRILDDSIDPSMLLDKFFESIVENGSSPTKHCLRFTPILRTCLASNQEQWVKVFADALAPYFKVDPDHHPKS
jgi:hypothetical protein